MKFIQYNLMLLCIISSYTYADDDWLFITSGSGYKIYLNTPSVKEIKEYSSTYVQAWIKSVIYKDQVPDGLSIGDYSMTLQKVDCDKQKLGAISITRYKKDKVFGQTYEPSFVDMQFVIPDTVGQTILMDICLANDLKHGRITKEDLENL